MAERYPFCSAVLNHTNSSGVFDILFEDKDCLVINKPSGISVLRDRSGQPNLFDQLQTQYPGAKLVHRLDKGTSGVLLLAKTPAFLQRATQKFEERSVAKYYVAIVVGSFPIGKTNTVNLPLRRGRKSRYRIAGNRADIKQTEHGWHIDSEEGRVSCTKVRTLRQGTDTSLVLLRPVTGRTHQLRVHLAWIGYPIVGDSLYGNPKSEVQSHSRLLLHQHRLRLSSGYNFVSPLPDDFIHTTEN